MVYEAAEQGRKGALLAGDRFYEAAYKSEDAQEGHGPFERSAVPSGRVVDCPTCRPCNDVQRSTTIWRDCSVRPVGGRMGRADCCTGWSVRDQVPTRRVRRFGADGMEEPVVSFNWVIPRASGRTGLRSREPDERTAAGSRGLRGRRQRMLDWSARERARLVHALLHGGSFVAHSLVRPRHEPASKATARLMETWAHGRTSSTRSISIDHPPHACTTLPT